MCESPSQVRTLEWLSTLLVPALQRHLTTKNAWTSSCRQLCCINSNQRDLQFSILLLWTGKHWAYNWLFLIRSAYRFHRASLQTQCDTIILQDMCKAWSVTRAAIEIDNLWNVTEDELQAFRQQLAEHGLDDAVKGLDNFNQHSENGAVLPK